MARRGRLGLLSVAVGVTLTFAALPGQAETLRSGLARAQLAKVVPYVGIPSVGAGAGVAQAEIQGASAHASAGLADFGSMAMILGAVASKAPVPLPDLPSPITADDRDHPDVSRDPVTASATPPPAPPATPPSTTPPSTTPPSTTPPSTTPSSTTAAAANPARASLLAGLTAEPASTTTTTTTAPAAVPPAVTPAAPAAAWEEAHASKAPASRATVRGPELGVPGVVMFTGAESRASADGGVSSSTVTLGRLVLGGANGAPEVALSNLVWTARQAMGRPGTAGFTIGSVTVAGQALPLPAGVAPADVLKTVNDALEPAGLRLEVPAVTADTAGAAVSSLVIQVRNPETVANLVGQATQPAAPVLDQLLDTLLAAAPDAAASRLVVNALLATGTTRGGGRLELGGVAARIGNVEVADLTPPAPPAIDAGDAPPAFAAPFDTGAAPPAAPVSTPDSAFGNGYSSSSDYESALPVAAPIAPPGAARTPSEHAVPGGSKLAARPVGTTAPGGASAPLVLGAALLAVLILALGDKLRLRRSTGA